MVKISIIIPTYNRAHLISYSLKSILKQRMKNIEIIIIDDGSTDNTYDVVRKFTNREVSYFKTDSRGVNFARNLGLNNAKGEYIFNSDDDLILTSKSLETLSSFLDKNRQFDLVYADIKIKKENGKTFLPYSIDFDKKWFEIDNIINFGMYRKEVLKQIDGYDENKILATGMEDWEFYLRLSDCFKVIHIPEIIALHRLHGENITTHKMNYTNYGYVVNKRLNKTKNGKSIVKPFNGYYVSLIHRFIYKYKGPTKKAILFAKKFIAITPKNSEAYIALSLAHLADKKFEVAINALYKANHLSSGNWKNTFNIYRLLSFTYNQLGNKVLRRKFAKESLKVLENRKLYFSKSYDPILTVSRFINLLSYNNEN